MRVLVAAASRHGATQEIAEAIGRVLEEQGIEVDVWPIDEVETPATYDACVLGSAVYVGSWLEAAREFVDAHAAELAARPTWLFSSGPIGDPSRPDADHAVEIDEIFAKAGAREHHLFAGRLDKSLLGFGERAVVLAFRAAEGDFRDWDEVESWAREIADALREPAGAVQP
jgi:menaquinone-dependent protoporphyrinogen oxidase